MLLCFSALVFQPVHAQDAQPAATGLTVALTLDDALQLAFAQNYALRSAQLDVATAQQQVREGWGSLYPQVSANSSYTRTLVAANPFAGSQAGGLFSSLGAIDWLVFNEDARSDDDPGTNPIGLSEFFERQQEGLDAAGIVQDTGGNPFLVENQFQNGITISQSLFDLRAFLGASGASTYLQAQANAALDRQEQLLIDEVRRNFYQALLTQRSTDVLRASVARTSTTLNEVAQRVTQGVLPKYQRLSTEVSLSNLETQLVQAEAQAATALDLLKMTLGMPVEQPIRLVGELEVDQLDLFRMTSLHAAVDAAIAQRPDLEQLRHSISLQQVQVRATQASFYPTVNAFANFSFTGSVPGNRNFTISDPNDPFRFTAGSNGFFSGSYWDPGVNVGLQLRWDIFTGFQNRARLQQQQIQLDRLEVQEAQTLQAIRVEIQQARRNMDAARQRIAAQQQTIQTAELNYQFARTRLAEGVATRLEERDASTQLDQSRLNYAQAVHDYLVARSAFQTAIGAPLLDAEDDFNMTAR